LNTARLKSIVIIILLLANAFLLVLLLSQRAEENAAHGRSFDQLIELYAANGIALDRGLLENFSAELLDVQPARDLDAEQAFAAGVIGSVSSIDSGGGIYRYYSADGMNSGVCLIRSSGALEATLNRAVDDPDRFCSDLCIPYGYRIFEILTSGADTTITAYCLLGELEVYNGSLTFSFSSGTLTSVTGTLLPPIDTADVGTASLDAVTALVRFLDYRNASGAVCTEIMDIRGGYLLQSTTAAPQRLVPVLRVATDVYDYYVNIETGEVTRV